MAGTEEGASTGRAAGRAWVLGATGAGGGSTTGAGGADGVCGSTSTGGTTAGGLAAGSSSRGARGAGFSAAAGGLTTTDTAGGATTTTGRAAGTAPAGALATTAPAGGRVAIAGGAGAEVKMGGADRGCGTILRGAGVGAGAAVGAAATGGCAGTGCGGCERVVGEAVAAGAAAIGSAAGGTGLAGGGAAGFTGKRAWRASSSCSFFLARIAFITSPGLEMCERSILGTIVCPAWRAVAELAWGPGLASCAKRARTFSASSASSELECVLTLVTPSSGSNSIIARGLTSNSRARSLIRTLLIRLFSIKCCQTALSRS